jgi:hypothetical protein
MQCASIFVIFVFIIQRMQHSKLKDNFEGVHKEVKGHHVQVVSVGFQCSVREGRCGFVCGSLSYRPPLLLSVSNVMQTDLVELRVAGLGITRDEQRFCVSRC